MAAAPGWTAGASSPTSSACRTSRRRRVDRITSDEEERMRFGYDLLSSYQYARDVDDRPILTRGDLCARRRGAIASAIYAPTATLWRINLGWQRRKDAAELGFRLNLENGRWSSKDPESAASRERRGGDDRRQGAVRRGGALRRGPAQRADPVLRPELDAEHDGQPALRAQARDRDPLPARGQRARRRAGARPPAPESHLLLRSGRGRRGGALAAGAGAAARWPKSRAPRWRSAISIPRRGRTVTGAPEALR